MSDRDFDELFEKAPDWPHAVRGLRTLISSEIDEGTHGSKVERLALLKDTARDTILAILADHGFTVSVNHDRYTGGHLEFSGTSFHVFVLRKAFFCYRRELVEPSVLVGARRAREAFELANRAESEALKLLSEELRAELRGRR